MDKLKNIKEILESIHLLEGTQFECDENTILEEYKKQGENKSSLAIKILSIFGGIIATSAFLGFLAIAGLYNSEEGLLIFGIGFIITAIWLNREYDKLIIDTFSISIYVIGFTLLVFGLLEMDVDKNFIAVLIIMIALCSLFIIQNYILSFISVLTINASLLTLIISNDLYNLIHLYIAFNTILLTYCFLNEAKIITSNNKLSKLYNPIRIGLIFSLLFGLIIIGIKDLIPISQNYVWLSSVIMVFIILFLVKTITKITKIETLKNKLMIYSLSVLILIPTVFSPSISGAILIILLSFFVNYKTGLVIGIVSLIYFISQYYYDLNFTLLTKSIILFSSGIVFILFYLFTNKKLHTNEKI